MTTLTVEYFKTNYASLKDIPDDDIKKVLHKLEEDWIRTTEQLAEASRDNLIIQKYPLVFVNAVKPAEEGTFGIVVLHIFIVAEIV